MKGWEGRIESWRVCFPQKRQRFVAEYLTDLNASKAAERAGYSQGQRLLTSVDIQAEIERQNKVRTERLEVKADDVLRDLQHILDFDIRGLFDESGKLKPIHALTRERWKGLASYRVNNQKGEKEQLYTIRLCDRFKALRCLD